MADSDNIDDKKGQYVSIYVPFPAGSHYHYFRLGEPNTTEEALLPAQPNIPGVVPGNGSYDQGIVLYSTDTITVTAPSISTFTADSLSTITDVAGKKLYSATYTAESGVYGAEPVTVSFNHIDSLAMSLNVSANFLTGDALTAWNGNDQSIGYGGLLWSNYGLTTNLFGGSVLNITQDTLEIQGYGEYKYTKSHNVAAADFIAFTVDPLATLPYSETMTRMLKVLAVATAGAVASATVYTAVVDYSALDGDTLKKNMGQAKIDLQAATLLLTGVQALTLVLAAVMKLKQPAEDAKAQAGTDPGILITPLRTTLTSPSHLMQGTTASIEMARSASVTSQLVTIASGLSTEIELTRARALVASDQVMLRSGTSSVAVGPAGITLTNGANSIAVGAAGISINGTQLNQIANLIGLYA